MLFCVTRGITSDTIGMFGRYLDTRRAVCPVRVKTTIIAAPTLDAARTALDANASDCDSPPPSSMTLCGSCCW